MDDKVIAEHLPTKFRFVEIAGGAQVLFAQVVVPVPAGGKVKSVEGDALSFNPKLVRNGKFLLLLGALSSHSKITLEGSSQPIALKVELHLPTTAPLVVEQGCKALDINIRSSQVKAATFFGLFCKKQGDRTLLTLSGPQELELDSATMFETAGKGERWKSYEISAASIGTSKETIGEFSFHQNEFPFKFTVYRKSLEGSGAAVKEVLPLFSGNAGLGIAQIATKPSGNSASSFDPLLLLDVTSRIFYHFLRTRAALNFAIPLGGTSFYELTGGIGPAFGSNHGTEVTLFLEYMALGVDQTIGNSTYSFRHNQFGVDLWFLQHLTEQSALQVVLQYSGLGGSSSAMAIGLAYPFSTSQGSKWLPGLVYQTESTTVSGATVQFSQAMFNLGYGF